MIVELKNERFLKQLQNLVVNKIPCGLFCGFAGPQNSNSLVDQLKNIGINLTCICVIDDSHKIQCTGGGGISLVTLEEFSILDDKPEKVFFLGRMA